MEMHLLGKILIGISMFSVVVILGFLGYEVVTGIIALTGGLALTTAQFGGFVGIVGIGIVALTYGIEAIILLW
jgi:hypothetical protein